ncbi:MAG: tetratricopeptide repeat protein, partial [bacterium]
PAPRRASGRVPGSARAAPEDGLNHGTMRAPLAAVAASLLLRAAYYAQLVGNPYFDTPVMDEGYHDLWAREIASGDLAGRLPFFRAPFYPYWLGALYALFGPSFGIVRAIQLALGAVTPLLTILIARRLLPDRPRLAAATGFVVALDAMLFYFEADLLLESLLAPLAALFVWLLLRARETASPARWLLAGTTLGAFAITRPNVLLFAPFALAIALFGGSRTFPLRRRVVSAATLTAGTCLLVLPVTAANWIGGHDRVLVAWQGGLNFFLGNNPEANGWSATAPSLFRIDWWGGYEDQIRLAEKAEGRKLLPSEVSEYWMREANRWWREHPRDALLLTARKIVLFLSGVEFGNNRDIEPFFREFVPGALPALWLYTILVPLALVGMVRLARRDWAPRVVILFAAVYAATIVAFFVTARYRVPLRPLLAVFAVAGAGSIWDAFRARPLAGAVPLAIATAAGLVLNLNPWVAEYRPSGAQFWQSVANVHHQKGDVAKAIEAQERAIALDPTYPKGNLNLGTLYMMVGDVGGAVRHFEAERRLDPRDGRNLASLAQAYDRQGRGELAELTYTAAEEAGLEDAPALYNHGVCLERLGRPGEAEALYLRAIAADSTHADSWNNLGVLEARQGRIDEAVPLWRKALDARPGHAGATDNLERARRLAEERETGIGGSAKP